jgi:hypothetical protein
MYQRRDIVFSFWQSLSWVFFLATALMFFATVQFAQAQAGVSITPALIEEAVEPGVTYNFSFSLENTSAQEQIFYLSVRNITGVTDGNTPVFAPPRQNPTGLELADWIVLPVSQVLAQPGEGATIDFEIRVPDNASPGSHFGGVFVSVVPPEIDTVGASVGYEVGNIISLRVAGEAEVEASLRQFSTDQYVYSNPIVEFSARLENTGNVLIRPSGPVEITNMFGRTVGQFTFNPDGDGVFPGVTRDYVFNWEYDGTGFGRYEATLSPVYGEAGVNKTLSSTVTFWVLPMNIIGPALGVLAVVLLVTIGLVRLYIRRTLAQYQPAGRRLARQRRRGGGSSMFLATILTLLIVSTLFMIGMLLLFA